MADFVAVLCTAARHCAFVELDTMLRDRLVCGMRDERTQRRLFARKRLSFADALEEALSAEAATANTRAVRSGPKPMSTPVHHQTDGEDGQSSQDEAVGELGASRQPRAAAPRAFKCASCGGPHPRQQCKFRDVSNSMSNYNRRSAKWILARHR